MARQKNQRDPIILAPEAGRDYTMGPVRAVFKADGAETRGQYSISEWWLEPYTKGPGTHQHDEDDVFFVIEGTMSFFVGGRWIDAPKGSLVIAPGNTPHDFENRSAARAGALNFSAPGDFEPHMAGIAEWFRERSSADSRTANAPAAGRAAQAVINFYSVAAEYGELSNFAPYPITLKRKVWPTSEHYFQAQKFKSAADQEAIRTTKSPMIAARMGRDRKRKLRPDWERVKLGVMREALDAKFTQHDDLRTLLLGTGDARLVEHTENDAFWGDGGDGSGRNELGRLLMAVRTALRAG